MYHTVYGATRRERAHRLATNQAPYYTEPPRPYVYPVPNPPAHFTEERRYVEDVRGRNVDRDYVVVRSQKTCRQYKKYYRVRVGDVRALQRGIFNYRGWRCSCKDDQRCKHILAVVELYRIPLRL